MLRIAVADDEASEREYLCRMLQRFADERGLSFDIQTYDDGSALLDLPQEPDIILLDIEMQGVDGMKAARRLRSAGVSSQIMFVTNMAQYAIKGYEVDALDFLVKPVRYPTFAFKFERAVREASQRRRVRVKLETKNGLKLVDASEIRFVEVKGHKLTYHTTSGDVEVWGTMKEAAAPLEGHGFASCNACYLVNLDQVTGLEGDFVLVGPDSLKMSRGKRAAFVDALTRSIRP